MTSSIPTRNKAFYRGLANGYRSGLEQTIAEQLRSHKIDVLYETDRINYVVPSRVAKYTPDFKLPKKNGIWFLETKGIWAVADRAKHLLIKDQQPQIDIRFVFSNQGEVVQGVQDHLCRLLREAQPMGAQSFQMTG